MTHEFEQDTSMKMERVEQCEVMKYLRLKQMIPTQIQQEFVDTLEEPASSYDTVEE